MSKQLSWSICIGWLLLAFGVNSQSLLPHNNQRTDSITLSYAEKHQTLTIQHCFLSAPDYVEANDSELQQLSSNILWQQQAAEVNTGYVELPDGQPGCLSYVVDGRLAKNSKRLLAQHPESILLKIDAMIWQPNDRTARALPAVNFEHASHIVVSAPWELVSRGPTQTQYQMKASPRYADGYIAIGHLKHKTIMIGESQLRLAVMAGEYANKLTLLQNWIKVMAASVAAVGQDFPLPDVQVLIVVVNGSGEPVPWGQVNRAGGPGVLFLVNGNQTKEALMADWTAAHEFSHLLMPYTPYDRWLAEGFASYHQNMTRLRAGLLAEKTAWQKMLAGFERGRKTASKITAPPLKQANRRHNMQMYWGGAVIALKAEVALQQQTQGAITLSKTLAGLQDCCLGLGRGWSAQSLFKELDRISQTQIFTELYENEVKQRTYPAYQQLLSDLGVKQNNRGQIELDDAAPLAAIRKNIGRFSSEKTL